jgi:hypothetical protein
VIFLNIVTGTVAVIFELLSLLSKRDSLGEFYMYVFHN